MNLSGKINHLKSLLRGYQSVVVAFSGGVDSSVLLKISTDVLGEKVLAVTIASEFQIEDELKFSGMLAKNLGVRHKVIRLNMLKNKTIRHNPRQRCYFCKKEIMKMVKKIASAYGFKQVIDGSNADDTMHLRPGKKALKELSIKSPLALSGFSKKDIRQLAKKFNLENWARPSSSCLATRLPYGETLTKRRLKQISLSEAILREEGFRQVRVRAHGNIARIEVEKGQIKRLTKIFNAGLANRLKKTGFKHICLDLEGYRSGSMNSVKNKT